MRVFVFGLVGTNMGGIESFLLNMNRYMSEECIFDYIIEENECVHQEQIEKKGGKIYKVTSRTVNPKRNLQEIKKIFKENKDEVKVVYFNLSSLSWIFPELIARHYEYRVIIHSHNAMLIDANNDLVHRIANRFSKFIVGKIKCDKFACSELAADFMFGKKKDVEIVRNAIETEKFKYDANIRETIRKQYGLNDKKVVGFIGRLSYQKNPLFVIDVFEEIIKQDNNCVLVMLGDGNLRGDVEKSVRNKGLQDCVIILGNVRNVNEYVQCMDLLLLPSVHEGLGIALIEAQTSGLPCVTSDKVVPQEAKISDLVEFVNLDKNAREWANICNCQMEKYAGNKREKYYRNTSEKGFDIKNEARRLEELIIGDFRK